MEVSVSDFKTLVMGNNSVKAGQVIRALTGNSAVTGTVAIGVGNVSSAFIPVKAKDPTLPSFDSTFK